MRVLGIDYGERRIGLAVSDTLGLAAHGLPTLPNKSEEQVMDALRAIIEERGVEQVVVGLPRNMNGSLGRQAAIATRFAESLKPLGLPVHLVDERLTTEQAERVMTDAGLSRRKQRRNVDRMAAQFILQKFLDASRIAHSEDGSDR